MNADRDDFELEWHGDVVVVTPASSVENMSWDVVEQAADLLLAPLGARQAPLVVVDLSRVSYFGSVFLALLLRCHKLVRQRGGEIVLCGASKLARELLQITNLDTLWAIYETRDEALEVVGA